MQITLHERPDEAARLCRAGSVRHFGVTLERDDFDAVVTAHLDDRQGAWVAPVSTDDEGKPTEQTKAKIADPSGNVIELKTYADVAVRTRDWCSKVRPEPLTTAAESSDPGPSGRRPEGSGAPGAHADGARV